MLFVWDTVDVNEFKSLLSPLLDSDDVRLLKRSPVSTTLPTLVIENIVNLRTFLPTGPGP